MEQNSHWIFAYSHNGTYVPETVYSSQEEAVSGLEYGDVAQSRYQLWHYPSGDIFTIQSNKELDAENYQTSHGKDGVIWLPVLVKIGNDIEKVAEAYHALKR